MTTAVEIAERGHRIFAFVSFNGTATSGSASMSENFNISSVDSSGTGQFKINFENNSTNTNYIIVGNAFGFNASRSTGRVVTFNSNTSAIYNDSKEEGYFRITVKVPSTGDLTASEEVHLIIFA